MADRAIKTSQLPVWSNTVSGNDSLVLLTRSQPIPNTYIVNVSVIFSNINSISANTLVIRGSNTPANSTSTTIVAGTFFWDSSYLYVATANNVVKRAALTTF